MARQKKQTIILVGETEEAVEQRQADDSARRQDGQDVEAGIQQKEYDGGNGQVQGGRLLLGLPRIHQYNS